MDQYTRLQAAKEYTRAVWFLDPGNYPKGFDYRNSMGHFRCILSRAMARLASSEP